MPDKSRQKTILIVSVFVAGLCSIIYELLISTASSYFLGDSVKHFSITIGTFMASMGVGSFLSRSMKHSLLSRFIFVEMLLGLVGGLCVPFLYFIYAYVPYYSFFMILTIVGIGTLTGFEVPLLTRIMERYYSLKVNLSNVLTLDYLGALGATLLFPFLLLPFLGTFQTSLVFGLINVLLGIWNIWAFQEELSKKARRFLSWTAGILLLLLGSGLLGSGLLLNEWSSAMYEDRIVYSKRSPYQQIVITKFKDDVRLFLNGNLQFSSLDEHRYHEALVHIPMSQLKEARDILILGGGDGLAARELLKYDTPEKITIVDLDTAVFQVSRKNTHITKRNRNSLVDPKVETKGADAMNYLETTREQYDLIIADLPDPNNVGLARLYSRTFYELVHARLKDEGVFVTQSTSPFHATKAFWCIFKTIEQSRLASPLPYHFYIPSFGEWGFVMASKKQTLTRNIPAFGLSTEFLTPTTAQNAFTFPKDLLPKDKILPNTLDRPKVLEYYLGGWEYYY